MCRQCKVGATCIEIAFTTPLFAIHGVTYAWHVVYRSESLTSSDAWWSDGIHCHFWRAQIMHAHVVHYCISAISYSVDTFDFCIWRRCALDYGRRTTQHCT